jgi:hypothetical protein
MESATSKLPLKIGLFLVAFSWFSFSFYEFTLGIFGRATIWPIVITDVPSVIGLGFRTVGGFIAVVTILLSATKKGLTRPEVLMSLRWVVLIEAAYFISLLPSGLLGLSAFFNPERGPLGLPILSITLESTLPCMLESTLIPVVLTKLFFELSPEKPSKGPIKWGLIAGALYLFVFWLNNTVNWIYGIIEKGINYVILYPINLFSFAITTVGLLLLAVYAAHFSKKSFGKESLAELDLKRVGVIITALGLYFNVLYVLYLLFGAVGGWGSWYAWFLNHNMDLWLLSLPLVGLPLLFHKQSKTEK